MDSASGQVRLSFERLSTGNRINRASDDAAGLALSASLEADRRIFTRGILNGNEMLNLVTTASEALGELGSIITRILELAEQSANGVLSNRQRSALDQEAQALRLEYGRIIESTEFNEQDLFNDMGPITAQLGVGTAASLTLSIGAVALDGLVPATTGDGTFSDAGTLAAAPGVADVLAVDLDGDGNMDLVTANDFGGGLSSFLGDGTGGFGPRFDFGSGDATWVQAGYFNGDSILDLVTTDADDRRVSLYLGNGDGTFGARTQFLIGGDGSGLAVGDVNEDGNLDVLAVNSQTNQARFFAGDGNGSFAAATSVGLFSTDVELYDLNGDNNLDLLGFGNFQLQVALGNGNGTFQAATSYAGDGIEIQLADVNADGNIDAIGLSNNDLNVHLGNGDGTFAPVVTSLIGLGSSGDKLEVKDMNGDGNLDVVVAGYGDQNVGVTLGNGDGTFGAASFTPAGDAIIGVAVADFNEDGGLDIAAGLYNNSGINVLRANLQAGISSVVIDISTRSAALATLDIMSTANERVMRERGNIGAYYSRVETAVANLIVQRDAYSAAHSQIVDADIAAESALLMRSRLLQQAATSMLAQANQQPELALRLLA